MAIAKPPMIVNIMVHDTSCEPLRSFMERARALESQPNVVSVSLMAGFAYADVPQMGPSVIVVSDKSAQHAKEIAHDLGNALWDARAAMNKPLPDAAQAVHDALDSDARPVVLVETGDNVGGGSAGDATFVLAELIRQGAQKQRRMFICAE